MLFDYISACTVTDPLYCFPCWSSKLFLEDLESHPCAFESCVKAMLQTRSYEKYFELSRNKKYPRFDSTNHNLLWKIFDNTPCMLYGENIFLSLIYKEVFSDSDLIVLYYCHQYSITPLCEWDNISKKTGCLYFEYWFENPYYYCGANSIGEYEIMRKWNLKPSMFTRAIPREQFIHVVEKILK